MSHGKQKYSVFFYPIAPRNGLKPFDWRKLYDVEYYVLKSKNYEKLRTMQDTNNLTNNFGVLDATKTMNCNAADDLCHISFSCTGGAIPIQFLTIVAVATNKYSAPAKEVIKYQTVLILMDPPIPWYLIAGVTTTILLVISALICILKLSSGKDKKHTGTSLNDKLLEAEEEAQHKV
jgi:hypothetical protein